MKNTYDAVKRMFKGMNAVSKNAIKYGTSLIFSLLLCAVYLYFSADSADNPYTYINLYSELLYSIKEYIGAVYVLPLTAEIIFLASGRKN